jgi:hypothetical protein
VTAQIAWHEVASSRRIQSSQNILVRNWPKSLDDPAAENPHALMLIRAPDKGRIGTAGIGGSEFQ